jgi:hypothetical protein
MSQKYDEYLEKHRQAVKKAYQWSEGLTTVFSVVYSLQ